MISKIRHATEFNFDGLVGPTHNYSGLSTGNIASESNSQLESNPKEGALQGLDKMRQLSKLGLGQALLPPQERPDLRFLRSLGFAGTNEQVLKRALSEAPHLLSAAGSASSMWTANAATVCPSTDSGDGRVHFTPANLNNKLHRSIESPTTRRILGQIFHAPTHFQVHEPLPANPHMGDEGAANHTRFCREHGDVGVHLFVYGRKAFGGGAQPNKYPARQTLEASESVARLHGLKPAATVFAQQSPEVIDLGVFHNDVISVGNECVFLVHEHSFIDTDAVLKELRAKVEQTCHTPLVVVKVKASEVSVADAVKSYLFNSQLVTLPNGKMVIIAPTECQQNPAVAAYLARLISEPSNPIGNVIYMDVRQSMRNGGGPACLRLRVVLGEEEKDQIRAQVFWNEKLDGELRKWVGKHYRDRLLPRDLADPQLLVECQTALDELTQILKIGSVYPFQLERDAR